MAGRCKEAAMAVPCLPIPTSSTPRDGCPQESKRALLPARVLDGRRLSPMRPVWVLVRPQIATPAGGNEVAAAAAGVGAAAAAAASSNGETSIPLQTHTRAHPSQSVDTFLLQAESCSFVESEIIRQNKTLSL